MNDNHEIIEAERENDLPAELIGDDSIIKQANEAEARIEAINKIKRVSLKVTNTHDWINQGGKPYLQVSGGEKVAGLFGISWTIDPPELVVEESGHYSYIYNGKFSWGGRKIEAIGSRGTKDPFFSKSKKGDIPVSEIDRNDVRKSALTNLIGNGVTRLLGIRNLTWEDLAEAGIKKDNVGSIDYKKPEMSEDSKELRDKIDIMINEMIDNDPKKFEASLMKVTSFIGKDGKEVRGKKKLEDISDKAMPVVYGKVDKAYQAWKKV